MAVIDQPETPGTESAAGIQTITGQPAMREFRAMPVDYSGVSNELSRGLERAKMPKDFASGLFAGATQLGKSLEGVGNFMAGLSEEIGKANAHKQIDAADIAMQKAHGDFSEWMAKNPDPTTWGGEWETRVKALHEQVMSQDHLSPYAKDMITHNFGDFAVKTGTGVQVAAAKGIFAQAKDTGLAKAEILAANGDFDNANAQIDTLVSKHYLHETEGVAHKAAFHAKMASAFEDNYKAALESATPDKPEMYDLARSLIAEGSKKTPNGIAPVITPEKAKLLGRMIDSKQQTDGVFARAMTDPQGVLDTLGKLNAEGKHENFPELSPMTREHLAGTARHQLNLFQQKEGEDIRSAMDGNALGDLNALREMFKYSNTDQKAALVQRWQGSQPFTDEAYNQLYSNVLGYKKDADPTGIKLGQLMETVKNSMSPERAKPLVDKLSEIAAGKTKDHDELMRMGMDTINHLHENDMLGVSWKEDAKKNTHLNDALQDIDKLKAFGITDKKALALIAGKDDKGRDVGTPRLTGAAAVDAFREAYGMADAAAKKAGLPSPRNPALLSKLTPYAASLFEGALKPGGFTDETARQTSAQRATEIRIAFEKWLQAQKQMPSPAQASDQLKTLVAPYLLKGTMKTIQSPAPIGPAIPDDPARLKTSVDEILNRHGL